MASAAMTAVQTSSPWASVASRVTCRPRTRPSSSVSASHSTGNSRAASTTGQWCWHSWTATSPSGSICGRVAGAGQGLGDVLRRARCPRMPGRRRRPAARARSVANASTASGPYSRGDEAQGRQGEVVVGLVAGGPTRGREREHAAGPATAPLGRRAVGRTVLRDDEARVDEALQVRRTPAGVIPSASARSAAVDGPTCSRARATRSAASPGNFTTSLLRNSPGAPTPGSRRRARPILRRVPAPAVVRPRPRGALRHPSSRVAA